MSAVFFDFCNFVEPAASCMEIRRLMALRVSTLRAIGSNPVTRFFSRKVPEFWAQFFVFQLDHINTTDRFYFLTTGRVLLFIRSAHLHWDFFELFRLNHTLLPQQEKDEAYHTDAPAEEER